MPGAVLVAKRGPSRQAPPPVIHWGDEVPTLASLPLGDIRTELFCARVLVLGGLGQSTCIVCCHECSFCIVARLNNGPCVFCTRRRRRYDVDTGFLWLYPSQWRH